MRSFKSLPALLLAGFFLLAGLAFAPAVASAQDYVTPGVLVVASPGDFTVGGTPAGTPLDGVQPTAGTGTAGDGTAGADDEVLGISQTAAGGGLAHTGSDVNAPVALGALLIGSGGLLLAAVRKRDENV